MEKIPEPYIHLVQYYETDRMGITHHSNYIRMMEEARHDFLEKIGWPYSRMEAEGIISPVTAVACKYISTTTFADHITITVKIKEFRGVRLKLSYEFRKEDGTLAAEGNSEHCFLDKDMKPIRMKKQFPELLSLLQSLSEND